MLFFMHFINSSLEENAYGTLPVDDLSLYYTHTHARVCVRFPTSVIPISLCTFCAVFLLEQTVLRWEKQQEFHLSLIKPINGGVWCLLHSFHTHTHRHTHAQACSCTHKCYTHPALSTLLPRLQYSNGHIVEFHQVPHHFCMCFHVFFSVCVCFRVFVLGVSGFSHAKSCKPENTDHKPPTTVSNQHSEPTHTHTHRATGCNKNIDTLHTHTYAGTHTL